MSDYSGFGRTSKAKVMTKLSKWEKDSSCSGFYVDVRKKIIDGKTTMVFSVSKNDIITNGKRPLPQEFTDFEKFEEHLEGLIQSIKSQI